MKSSSEYISGMLLRYSFLVLIGLGNLYFFYKILVPLTIIIVSRIFSLFTRTIVYGNIIETSVATIEIIPACTMGAAFFLILILILSIDGISPIKRLKVIATSLSLIFVLNIIRIIGLFMIIKEPYFDTVHWIFWHFLSTIIVVVVWIFVIRIYRIKSLPFISDVKHIKNLIKTTKKAEGKKKDK